MYVWLCVSLIFHIRCQNFVKLGNQICTIRYLSLVYFIILLYNTLFLVIFELYNTIFLIKSNTASHFIITKNCLFYLERSIRKQLILWDNLKEISANFIGTDCCDKICDRIFDHKKTASWSGHFERPVWTTDRMDLMDWHSNWIISHANFHGLIAC